MKRKAQSPRRSPQYWEQRAELLASERSRRPGYLPKDWIQKLPWLDVMHHTTRRGPFLTAAGYPTRVHLNDDETLKEIVEMRPPATPHAIATVSALWEPGVRYAPWRTVSGGWELLALDPMSRLVARMAVEPAATDEDTLVELALARRDLEALLDIVNAGPLEPLPPDSTVSPHYRDGGFSRGFPFCDDDGEGWKR